MDEQLVALYHRHVGTAFDRQLRFGAFLDKKNAGKKFQYDTTTALLAFGKLTFEAPMLGSHAFANNSWLWAWSNKNLKLSLTNRALGDTVRMMVHRLGVHQLGAAGFSLEPLLGPELIESTCHVFGALLTAELGYDAYYTAPTKENCVLILIRDDRLKTTEKRPLVRLITVFPQLLRSMPVFDHKAAFLGYAQDFGLTVTEEPNVVRVTSGSDSVTATFDTHNRLTQLEGTVKPETAKKAAKPKAPAKKPQAAAGKPKPVAGKPKPVAKKPVAKKAAKPKAPAKKPGKK